MNLIIYKSLAAVSIFALTLIAGLLPLRIALRNKQLLHLGDAFASGIFLSAALLHLLPDAEAGFAKWRGGIDGYPVAQLICAVAFVMLLLMEHGLMIYGRRKFQQNSRHEHHGDEISGKGGDNRVSDAGIDICCHGASCVCSNVGEKNVVTPYLLLLILSVHSFIEGSAIGISGNFAGVLIIYIAVIAHKCSESLALVSNLFRYALHPKRICWLIIIFSLLTPTGIFSASLIENLLHLNAENNLFACSFNAIAAGTFLYLGSVHIMECEKSFEDLGEITALILGIGVMAVVALWV